MSSHVKLLLEELYLLEPNLREKEDAIVRIIETMLSHKPQITIDESFRRELKEKILEEIALLEKKNQVRTFTLPSWIFPTFGTAFACLAVGIFVFNLDNDAGKPVVIHTASEKGMVSFAPSINQVGKNGFGIINNLQARQSQNMGTSMSKASPEIAASNSDNSESMTTTSPSVGGAGFSDARIAVMPPDMSMPAPSEMTVYNYTYTGALPTLPESMNVYRKGVSGFRPEETRSIVSSLSLDSVNLSALEDAGVTSINISENKKSGYALTIDFTQGSIAFFQNGLWPQLRCDESVCESQKPLSKDDIPSDEKLISIADTFFEKYNINKSAYGSPIIGPMNPMWMSARPMGGIAETMMVSDQVTVIYPLLIDNKVVYEEGGGYRGISVTVDIRSSKVTGLYGLEKQNLDSSLYETVQDSARLEKMIQDGGRYSYDSSYASYEGAPKITKKTLSLSEPTISYVHLYGEWKDGKMDEYYVPAYVFQVLEKPTDSYIQDQVIIPIIEEFTRSPAIPIGVMPAIEPMMVK